MVPSASRDVSVPRAIGPICKILLRKWTTPLLPRLRQIWISVRYHGEFEETMFTATADLILPSTTTGSFPRPRWFDVSMWGRPLDTCMLDVRFREKFQDAMAVMISDQERSGLDVLTHGDLHVDEDLAGRAWHHYP